MDKLCNKSFKLFTFTYDFNKNLRFNLRLEQVIHVLEALNRGAVSGLFEYFFCVRSWRMSSEFRFLSGTSVHETRHPTTSQECQTVLISCHRRTAIATAKWASCIASLPRLTETRRRCLGWPIIRRIWRRHQTAALNIRRSCLLTARPAWAPTSAISVASPLAAAVAISLPNR